MLILKDKTRVFTALDIFWFKSCVLSSGEIVAYNIDGLNVLRENGKERQDIPRLCKHDPSDILGIEIEGKEYICVSCITCRNMTIVNRTKQTGNPPSVCREDMTVALSGCDAYIMCTAGNGTSYISDERGIISELDTSTKNFKIKNIFSMNIHDRIYCMCYIPGHDLLVLSSDRKKSVCAVRLSDRQIIWCLSDWRVAGKECKPGALLYLPTHRVLMVGDRRWISRIVCVRPETGETMQVLRPKDVGGIFQLHVRGQQLVIVHGSVILIWVSTFTFESDDYPDALSNEETPRVPAGVNSAAQVTAEDIGVDHGQGLTSAAQETVEDKGMEVRMVGINCCGSSASIYLFGSLKYLSDNSTLVTVKVYISGYRAKDNMQEIEQSEMMTNSCHLHTGQIDLSLEPYVPDQSELTLRLRPEVPTDWAPFMDEPTKWVLKLNKALRFRDQHICGQPPREVAAFSVKSSTQKTFIGKVEAKVNVVTCAGGMEENTRNVFLYLEPSVRSTKIQELPPDVTSQLLKLSKIMTKPMDLSHLGSCLRISDREVDVCILNNPRDFTAAVYSVLKKWRARQDDPERALKDLMEAFKKIGLEGYANQVLKEA